MEETHEGGGRAYLPPLCPHSSRWVAYQYPGYWGYQYLLDQDWHGRELRTYSKFGPQALSGSCSPFGESSNKPLGPSTSPEDPQ